MSKGQVSSIFEIYFGVIIILFIMISSFYFAERSEINAEADVQAVNTGLECYSNLNTILKTESIFDEKTSIYLGKSATLQADLDQIKNKLSELSNFKLSILDKCDNFQEGCPEEESIAEFTNVTGIVEQGCAFPIAREECLEDTPCTIFLKMEVYE